MPRSTAPLPRYTRLRPFSRKRAKRCKSRAACRRIVFERDGGLCRCRVSEFCTGKGEQVHERILRSRGGDIADPENCLLVCAPCHRYLHDHPAWAEACGYIASNLCGRRAAAGEGTR